MILCLRTDSPVAELSVMDGDREVASETWQADRALARDLLAHLDDMVAPHGSWDALTGLVVFQGPGSFTGLRIGMTVMNTLADGLKIPIAGTQGDNWRADGLARLATGENDQIVLPEYGAPPHITQPRK